MYFVQKDCSESQHLVQYSPNNVQAFWTGEVKPTGPTQQERDMRCPGYCGPDPGKSQCT